MLVVVEHLSAFYLLSFHAFYLPSFYLPPLQHHVHHVNIITDTPHFLGYQPKQYIHINQNQVDRPLWPDGPYGAAL